MTYHGSCHCGAITFHFEAEEVEKGVRCNCSICKRKGALMSPFLIAKEELHVNIKNSVLETYRFGSNIAKHHFCKVCGIYPFHETFRKPGHYRVNLGCLDEVDTFTLDYELFDGASL